MAKSFPALSASYIYVCFELTRVVTLVLVLRHSIENFSSAMNNNQPFHDGISLLKWKTLDVSKNVRFVSLTIHAKVTVIHNLQCISGCLNCSQFFFIAVTRHILWISGKKDRLLHRSWKGRSRENSYKQVQRASEKS